ncbi:MAG: dihydroorotate dehydrogenase electron transfer subunit [Candidatus Cloacimonetes bacterium]|nr:dihydroorotate dehydrogenase electron transfer subunit [Candidatus Cloacimonadota bacterium]
MFYKVLPIVEKEVINNKYFIITFTNFEMAEQSCPGQFFKLKGLEQEFPILPRPFSVFKKEDSKLSFLIKVVGTATKNLSQLKIEERVALLGPLGNGFQIHNGKKVLIVSGGIGYAPLNFLRDGLNKADNEITFFHGGKNANDVFSKNIRIYTEDGSIGEKGLVTDGVEEFLSQNQIDVVYTCGPENMLRKVKEICEGFKTKLYMSMETVMACGIGSCCGCAIKVEENGKPVYKKVCKDGPVFDGYKIV